MHGQASRPWHPAGQALGGAGKLPVAPKWDRCFAAQVPWDLRKERQDMHPGLIGGIVGTVVGAAGGLVGAYFSIRNTNGPRERAFMIKASLLFGVFVAAFVAGVCLLPTPYKPWLVGVYVPVLVVGILFCNRRQTRIRSQESRQPA